MAKKASETKTTKKAKTPAKAAAKKTAKTSAKKTISAYKQSAAEKKTRYRISGAHKANGC